MECAIKQIKISPGFFPPLPGGGEEGERAGIGGKGTGLILFYLPCNFAIRVAPTARKFVREKWSFCFPCSKHVIKMLI